MNRQQAEHILDAYVRMRMRGGDEEAADALREVILDAMATEPPKPSTYPGITYPTVTWGDTNTNPLPNRNIITCCNGAEVER